MRLAQHSRLPILAGLLIAAAALLLAMGLARGATLVTEPFLASSQSAVTSGYAFTIGAQPLSVFELGVLDAGGDRVLQTTRVGLWTDDGTLLRTLTFSQSLGTFEGGFCWLPLGAPILLAPNTTYRLGAYGAERGYSGTVASAMLAAEITRVASVGSSQGTFTFPNSSTFRTGGRAWVGPNVRYDIVPEPTASSLLCASVLFLARRRR